MLALLHVVGVTRPQGGFVVTDVEQVFFDGGVTEALEAAGAVGSVGGGVGRGGSGEGGVEVDAEGFVGRGHGCFRFVSAGEGYRDPLLVSYPCLYNGIGK